MRLQPAGGSKSIQLSEEQEKIIKIGCSLSAEDEAKLVHLLQQNKDLSPGQPPTCQVSILNFAVTTLMFIQVPSWWRRRKENSGQKSDHPS